MTETEWMNCAFPDEMLDHLRGRVSERKFWLFACACCRLLWHRFSDWRIRRVVEAAELFAEGRDAGEHLAAARAAVRVTGKVGVAGFAQLLNEASPGFTAAWRCLDGVYLLTANIPIRPYIRPNLRSSEVAGWAPLREKLVLLVHDIAGNPFRPIAADPVWLSANDGAAVKIAQEIDENRLFERMPILGDALEDAGCTEEGLLLHCRGAGPHARGCFVLDLVLGLS